MADTIALIKANPLLPAEDFVKLRREGIKNIEKLGSDLWTDYNESDPGITILEAICYAITDLAYRTGFDMQDILAPEELTNDTWKQIFYTARKILHNNPVTTDDYRKLIIDVTGVRNAWIEPSKDYEVPVWVDYNYFENREDPDCDCKDQEEKRCIGRLGLHDVNEQEVKAWYTTRIDEDNNKVLTAQSDITKLQTEIAGIDAQLKLEKDPTRIDILTAQRNKDAKHVTKLQAMVVALQAEIKYLMAATVIPSKIVEFEGLYNVMVEYEEDILEDAQREDVRQLVIDRLFRHRNLCEDFLSINAVDYVDFGIRTSVELEENADPDVIAAQIFFTIYQYFTPSVPFHTITEMLNKGYLVDEIFEGPALHHGFIDTVDLEKTALFRDIRLSDLINEIAEIDGLKAITYLQLPFDINNDKGGGKSFFNQWVEDLQQQRKIARIQPQVSQVIICKEREFITYNAGRPEDRKPDRMLKLFKDFKSLERKYKLKGQANDFAVPIGEYMNLEDYFPVTYSLPMCYNVSNRGGLPPDADPKKKIQALQLKGYLLFFEQILSGYLVQLNHVRDLFSFDDVIKHTYFSKALADLDDLQALVIDHGNHGEGHWIEILNDFQHVIQNLVEAPKLFSKRRNEFLDHMLARFSEDMSEYESLNRWLVPIKTDERLIHDKSRMLKDEEYYRISSNRGKGYNYAQSDYWNTNNVSGAERRLSRLMGFANAQRRSLAPQFIVSEPLMEIDETTKLPVQKKNKNGDLLDVIKWMDPNNKETVILTSVEVKGGCCTETLMNAILSSADDRRNYQFHDELKQRSRKAAGLVGSFWFELYDGTDPQTAALLATSEKFDSKEKRDKDYHYLQEIMEQLNRNEGLHLVEHLLLRPKLDEVLDEEGVPETVQLLNICMDDCDPGKGLNEGTDVNKYRNRIKRIPALKCFDQMPWILEYFKLNDTTKVYDTSILFQETYTDGTTPPLPLKFRRYEALTKREKDLHEFGSERASYKIVSNQDQEPATIKYSFIIYGNNNVVLAQSPYTYDKRTKKQVQDGTIIPNDIEVEIQQLMDYFGYQLDLYCDPDPCDNNEDPYSFRTTVLLPCWPKRLRDPSFRNLVEKTIQTDFPAHVHTRVVWVSINEMRRFETAYQDWLKEMSQTEMPGYDKVNPLVSVLNTLVPCGYCKDECD